MGVCPWGHCVSLSDSDLSSRVLVWGSSLIEMSFPGKLVLVACELLPLLVFGMREINRG